MADWEVRVAAGMPEGEALLLPLDVLQAVNQLSGAVALGVMRPAEALAWLRDFCKDRAAQIALFKNIGVELPVEHAEPCPVCGVIYDRRDLQQVMLHNSQGEDGRHQPVPVLEGMARGIQVGPCRWCCHWPACEKLGVCGGDCCRHSPPKFELDPVARQLEEDPHG